MKINAMKPSNFMWAWNDNAPQPDKLMTRARAANLLRCWRRCTRKPANSQPIKSIKRIAVGNYRVVSDCGETATLIIKS